MLVALLVIASPSSARPGQVYFCAFMKLFQTAAGGSSTVASNEKRPAISPVPCYFVFRSMSLQRAPAAATKTGVPTFTLICFGLASSRFGMLSVSTPF